MAPRVGFEPTTDRLTADCSTTELPRIEADLVPNPPEESDPENDEFSESLQLYSKAMNTLITKRALEARSGIEPLYTALQAAASPLCHRAPQALRK